MMSKVICHFYFNTGFMPCFKDYLSMHIHYKYDRYNMVRGMYHIIDLDLWFDTDFEEGSVYKPIRISEKSKYNFKQKR